MNTPMNTDTPETDAAALAARAFHKEIPDYVPLAFARRLERDRDALKAELGRVKDNAARVLLSGEPYEKSLLIAERDALREALDAFVKKYVEMVNSGDCGNWNPEEEKEVIQARAALAKGENK